MLQGISPTESWWPGNVAMSLTSTWPVGQEGTILA